MAKPGSKPKIRPVGKPDPRNNRKQSNPKTPGEQIQAIADNLESAVYSYQPVLAMESSISRNNMKIVLGIGGAKLGLFTNQLETNYKDVVGGRSNQSKVEKESAPELKQVSRDTTVDSDQKGLRPNSRSPKKPTGKPPSRKK